MSEQNAMICLLRFTSENRYLSVCYLLPWITLLLFPPLPLYKNMHQEHFRDRKMKDIITINMRRLQLIVAPKFVELLYWVQNVIIRSIHIHAISYENYSTYLEKSPTDIHWHLRATSRTVLSGNVAAILMYFMILASFLYLNQDRELHFSHSITDKNDSQIKCSKQNKFGITRAAVEQTY